MSVTAASSSSSSSPVSETALRNREFFSITLCVARIIEYLFDDLTKDITKIMLISKVFDDSLKNFSLATWRLQCLRRYQIVQVMVCKSVTFDCHWFLDTILHVFQDEEFKRRSSEEVNVNTCFLPPPKRRPVSSVSSYHQPKQPFSYTPLAVACEENNVEMAKKLLERGCNPNYRDDDHYPDCLPCLALVIESGSLEIIQLLDVFGCNFTDEGKSAVSYCVSVQPAKGVLSLVLEITRKRYKEAGKEFDINEQETIGSYSNQLKLIHYATLEDSTEAALELLHHGAKIAGIGAHQGTTSTYSAPLGLSASTGNERLLQAFLKCEDFIENGDIDQQDQDGNTPLHLSVRCGNMTCVKACVAAGASVTKVDKYGHLPIHIACMKSNLVPIEILQLLVNEMIAAGAWKDINAQVITTVTSVRQGKGWSPLIQVCEGTLNRSDQPYEKAQLLLENGANVNEVACVSKDTPLWVCIAKRPVDEKMIDFLLDAGCVVSQEELDDAKQVVGEDSSIFKKLKARREKGVPAASSSSTSSATAASAS